MASDGHAAVAGYPRKIRARDDDPQRRQATRFAWRVTGISLAVALAALVAMVVGFYWALSHTFLD